MWSEPATEPFGDWDPRPDSSTYPVDRSGLTGETKRGVWTRIDVDVLLEHEPKVWGMVDRFFTGVHDFTVTDLESLSSFETEELLTLQQATRREERRYLQSKTPAASTEPESTD